MRRVLKQVWAFAASFVVTRRRLLRDIHAAVTPLEHLVRRIAATPIGAVLTRSEFGSSRGLRIMSPLGINEL
jgi:hypothetical protein